MIRQATVTDIPGSQVVRHSVKENRLSDPRLVPNEDVEDYITRRGRGWVYEADQRVVAFAIVSVLDHNVWALFVDPEFDQRGIGRQLHTTMMDWYFEQTDEPIWLSTAPGTRAQKFYNRAGWIETGFTKGGEARFEMTIGRWEEVQSIRPE